MKIHIVKQGDTLYELSKKYGVSLEKIIDANPQLVDPNQLEVGAKIKVPTEPIPVPGETAPIIHKHTVKQGDSLWKLSKAWGVSLKQMIDANPQLKNPNALLVGEVVNIPSSNSSNSSGTTEASSPGTSTGAAGKTTPGSKTYTGPKEVMTAPVLPTPPKMPEASKMEEQEMEIEFSPEITVVPEIVVKPEINVTPEVIMMPSKPEVIEKTIVIEKECEPIVHYVAEPPCTETQPMMHPQFCEPIPECPELYATPMHHYVHPMYEQMSHQFAMSGAPCGCHESSPLSYHQGWGPGQASMQMNHMPHTYGLPMEAQSSPGSYYPGLTDHHSSGEYSHGVYAGTGQYPVYDAMQPVPCGCHGIMPMAVPYGPQFGNQPITQSNPAHFHQMYAPQQGMVMGTASQPVQSWSPYGMPMMQSSGAGMSSGIHASGQYASSGEAGVYPQKNCGCHGRQDENVQFNQSVSTFPEFQISPEVNADDEEQSIQESKAVKSTAKVSRQSAGRNKSKPTRNSKPSGVRQRKNPWIKN
ncbi:LysM peptidoglycan-binding domain-containing protein [Paenibacillus lemnae]|uniref:LysM peptidoglycan-binding domain-containing protein n=1 Tax=Paenibacillus lemnae TaxID=1330551 RepID=A0A848M404_PAELE|nr:LysM peptidoglycan-binding domain-containing protein [Paenibacillus lemnae]